MTLEEMEIMLAQMVKRSNAQAPFFDGRLLDNIAGLELMISDEKKIAAGIEIDI